MRAKHRTARSAEPSTARGRRPVCPADVRRAVRRAAARRSLQTGTPYDEDALSDALLVASELAGNALLHAGGVADFAVDVVEEGIRISVDDHSDRLPVITPRYDAQGRRRNGGRGWPIVCWLSHDVRIRALPSGGKRITAVVPAL
ncbi:ATP-binding protein [Streptomyces actuosus]|uniref:ATP-binding protein n=1 Tax=Streptomyces actuosus TaxID=1885 RepID=A0ABS2VL63_STRAS|nr:ATP-binding protein [Streptomyces actuosus]MBN0043844.1 ATP-binding protein [Streptomyces actuosus]